MRCLFRGGLGTSRLHAPAPLQHLFFVSFSWTLCAVLMPAQPLSIASRPPSFPMRALVAIRQSSIFAVLMTCVIIFNCIAFVLDGRVVSAATQSFMDTSNFACLIVFTVEIFICVAADGLKEYWGDSWNKFDVVVIGLSWIFDFLTLEASFSVFRILRVLKPLRLLKRIGSMQDLLEMYGLSTRVFASVYLVLALGLLFFAVLALQIFANVSSPPYVCTRAITSNSTDATSLQRSILPLLALNSLSGRDLLSCRPTEDGSWWDQRCSDAQCKSSALIPSTFQSRSSISRSSFESFGPALFTVYCMVQLEGWSDLMYDSMHSVSAVMPVYWVALVVVLAFGMNR
jgi:hypothetical protein